MTRNVIIIGSDSLRRTNEIHTFVRTAKSIDTVIETNGKNDFYEAVSTHCPRLVFLETSYWFELTGYKIAGYAAKYPQMRIAVFCNERISPAKAASFLNLGAESFIDMRLHGETEIARAFHIVMRENVYMPDWVAAAVKKYHTCLPDYATLRKSEFYILRLIALGNSIDDIAFKLHIAKGTVRNHILNIHKKTGVHRHIELFPLALKLQAVSPDELIAAELAVIEYA
jgi:DNA-binding NarL/FixJ family response regulator